MGCSRVIVCYGKLVNVQMRPVATWTMMWYQMIIDREWLNGLSICHSEKFWCLNPRSAGHLGSRRNPLLVGTLPHVIGRCGSVLHQVSRSRLPALPGWRILENREKLLPQHSSFKCIKNFSPLSQTRLYLFEWLQASNEKLVRTYTKLPQAWNTFPHSTCCVAYRARKANHSIL